MPAHGDRIRAKVKLRQGYGWVVKDNAKQIDGKVHTFTFGGEIDEKNSIYFGENLWIPDRENWPADAPVWLAEPDLEILDTNY